MPSFGYQLASRWTDTAIDGSGLVQGDATNLTWSFAPDGTQINSGGTSSLISFLDHEFGAGPGGTDYSQRPWFTFFDRSFERWSEVSGLSVTYEPNDDGLLQGSFLIPGFVGVRGDVRIAGKFIDGPSGVLAFNSLPSSGGDMTFDVADGEFFAEPLFSNRGFRNVIMHELGHGVGILHVESDDAAFLLEPFADTTFDGPQLDDILAAQRWYGDIFEKGNGNDTAPNATSLGHIDDGLTAMIGRDALSTAVFTTATDFVSIDGINDIDYFSFEIDSPALIDVSLIPLGPTYLEGPQGGDQFDYDTSRFNNLSVQLFDKDGVTQLAVDNSGGLGEPDGFSGILAPSPGTYFVRVQGEIDDIQLFELGVTITEQAPDVDFNDDGLVDCADIDALVSQIATLGADEAFDLTGDGNVDGEDLDQWLADAGSANGLGGAFLPGDATLDGSVDPSDFDAWNQSKFTQQASWCNGDFNADGAIDLSDLHIWNENRGQSTVAASVPEPTGLALGWLALALIVVRARKKI